MIWTDPTPASALQVRRTRLANTLGDVPALVVSGLPRARNYAANRYPFRAESHFLYLAGVPLAGAALLFDRGRCTLFVVPPADDDALWHGVTEDFASLRARTGVDAVESVERLPDALAGLDAATIPSNDDTTAAWQ